MGRSAATADEISAPAPPARYWIGISGPLDLPPDGDGDRLPYDRVVVGGMDFSRWTEDVRVDGNGDTQRDRRIGRVVPLSQHQVDAIRAAARRKVVRRVGTIGQILDSADRSADGTPRYTAEPTDAPIGRWLYMVPVPPGGIPRDEVPQANLLS